MMRRLTGAGAAVATIAVVAALLVGLSAVLPDIFRLEGAENVVLGEDLSGPDDTVGALASVSPEDLSRGPRTFLVGLNEQAMSEPISEAYLTFSTDQESPVHVEVRVPGQRPRRVPSTAGGLVELGLTACAEETACLVPFEIAPLPGPHDTMTDESRVRISLTVVYQRGQDSTPHRAEVGIASSTSDGPTIASAGLGFPITPIFLTEEDVAARRTMTFEIPREAAPPDEVRADGSLSATWAGGVLEVVASSTDVVVEVSGFGTEQTLRSRELQYHFSEGGRGYWPLPVPVELACDETSCSGEADVEFTLSRGEWVMFGWSNSIGMLTAAGTIIEKWGVRSGP